MVNKIQRFRIKSGAIAADGSATAYSSIVMGKILAVHVNYPTNTCTVDIDTDGELKSQKILDLAVANTDIVYYPRTPVCVNTGGETVFWEGTNKAYTEFMVHGRLLLTIASGTAGEEVSVDVIVEVY